MKTIHITDPHELLQELDLAQNGIRATPFGQPDIIYGNGWVFRGQRNAGWPLIASVFRPKAFDAFDNPKRSRLGYHKRGIDHHIVAEASLLRKFLMLADSLGLPTAFNSSFPKMLAELIDRVNANVGDPEHRREVSLLGPAFLEPMALAQHYGIPTRILDWSYNPEHALFFAASDAWRNRSHYCQNPDIAIWALNTRGYNLDYHGTSRLQILHPPYFANPNIQSQRGLFIYDQKADHDFKVNGSWPTLDAILRDNPPIWQTPDFLIKVIIPFQSVPNLLRMLMARGLSQARLTPNLDAVTQSVRDHGTLF